MLLGYKTCSMADPFTITDQYGQARYEVATVPDAERLALRPPGGGPALGSVVRDPGGTGGYQVNVGAEKAALIQKRGLFRKRYLIECAGAALSVGGSVGRDGGGSYWIFRNAQIGQAAPIEVRYQPAQVGLSPNGWQVLISVAEGEDVVLSIGLVLGVEYLVDRRPWGV